MEKIHAERALIGSNWRDDVVLGIEQGKISHLAYAQSPVEAKRVKLLLPAPVNCHAHAFQRAMAGLSEHSSGTGAESFWSWRKLMYRFLEKLTPDAVEAIAAFAQMEMLEAGFAACVEFHYLHHQPCGTPYASLAEMAQRIAAAASQSGIGLCLLPVLYKQAGCDGSPLCGPQRRFGNDFERFARLCEEAQASLSSMLGSDSSVAVGAHSLRAVPAEDFPALRLLARGGPIHMHLAEQHGEVEEVRAFYGRRPVEWVIENLEPDQHWCFVHCTQMRAHETQALAQSGAVAGLCPLTEASLGDGIFDGVRWLAAGGAIAIGSDSNIRISLAEELRQLDTSQRLRDHCRAALASTSRSTGRRLLEGSAAGGAQAAGRASGSISVGKWADFFALDTDHVDLAGLARDTILDSFVFSGDSGMISDVWSAGRHLVRGGKHIRRDAICERYRQVSALLRSGL